MHCALYIVRPGCAPLPRLDPAAQDTAHGSGLVFPSGLLIIMIRRVVSMRVCSMSSVRDQGRNTGLRQ